MGGFIFAWVALAALQEDVPTVVLPPQAPQAVEAPAPRIVVPTSDVPRRVGDGEAVETPRLGTFVTASVTVLLLLGGGLWALRRFGRHSRLLGGGGPIRLLGRRSVGARQEILLVEVGPRVLVVGSTKEGLASLAEITNPDEVAVLRAELPGPSERAAFRETLREGLQSTPPAEPPRNVYASITDELAEIRKTVHAWKA